MEFFLISINPRVPEFHPSLAPLCCKRAHTVPHSLSYPTIPSACYSLQRPPPRPPHNPFHSQAILLHRTKTRIIRPSPAQSPVPPLARSIPTPEPRHLPIQAPTAPPDFLNLRTSCSILNILQISQRLLHFLVILWERDDNRCRHYREVGRPDTCVSEARNVLQIFWLMERGREGSRARYHRNGVYN